MAKRNVKFCKPEEPSFIKKIKEKIGYQEGPTVETKKEQLRIDDDIDDTDDEKPVVVILKPDEISEAELAEYQKTINKDSVKDEKIVFRKPAKRSATESNHLVSSTKKMKDEQLKTSSVDKSKRVKNSSLLSFDEEEEEQE